MLPAGERVAHYVLTGPLGAGGMGEVYVAYDNRLERRVALKLLPTSRLVAPDARGRMLREARAASSLNHPNIVTVHEVGDHEGRTYIVMELVEGETFSQRLERQGGPLAPAEAVALVRQAAEAVTAAHEAHILHRDLKSQNLMIDRRGRVKVLDFGLSKRLGAGADAPTRPLGPAGVEAVDAAAGGATPDGAPTAPISDEPVTAYGARLGTPGYSAPELLEGLAADARSDVFSLGVVLYELLTGARPFAGQSFAEIRDATLAGRFLPPSAASAGATPRALDAVLASALAPGRADRFATPLLLVAAAEAAIGVGGGGLGRRLRWPIAALGVVALGGAGVVALRSDDASPPARAAASALPSPPADVTADRRLTSLGGCAYAPTFIDDNTVVFDLTRDGAVDLYRLRLPGGEVAQLTSDPGWEWRAVPGPRPGQALAVLSDPVEKGRSGIGVVDVASGKLERLATVETSAAVAVGDAVIYSRASGGELRRLRGDVDDVAVVLPAEVVAQQLVAARDGTRLAILSTVQSKTSLCIAELGPRTVRCLATPPLLLGRPAFSPDGSFVYYASIDGVRRVSLASGVDQLIVAGAHASSGVAVSPAGARLVYSDCAAHAPLVELASGRVIDDADLTMQPAAGPRGALVWVRQGPGTAVLVMRDPGGTVRQLTTPAVGIASLPSFDGAGTAIAFTVGGARAGIHILRLEPAMSTGSMPITDGKSDEQPAWTADGRVAFTRWDDAGVPFVYLASADGLSVTRGPSRPRLLLGANHATGRILLASNDGRSLTFWDPATGREEPTTLVPGATDANYLVISPSGKWAMRQTGKFGQIVDRARLDDPHPAWEKVHEGVVGEILSRATITDDGTVIGAPKLYRGDLHLVPARAGAHF